LGKCGGIVLDTCFGMGYTAMVLSRKKHVHRVVTIEKSRAILRVALENPWVQKLWGNPAVQIIRGDILLLIEGFPNGFFNAILHDPPSVRQTPELYTVEFYRQCWRVLGRRGRLYHYTGRPFQHSQRPFVSPVANRLTLAGFSSIWFCYQGIMAQKL